MKLHTGTDVRLRWGRIGALAWVLLAVLALPSFAQESAKTRKFRTTYKIDMFAEADFNSKKIGSIPTDVILESLQETERYGG